MNNIVNLFRSNISLLWFRHSRSSSKLDRLLMELPKASSCGPKPTELKNQRLQKHITENQKQRQRIKEKGAKYVPGTVNLQVLGNGSNGSPACIYMFTDQNRYLFNCGEGTQRLANEHKTKLTRLDHIFMTQTRWRHIGGLPGLSLTVQDAGVPEVTLHGPPGLGGFFKGMRKFVILRNLKVNGETTHVGEKFEDDVMTVTYVPLTKQSQHPDDVGASNIKFAESDDEDYYNDKRRGPNKFSSENDLFLEDFAESVTVYICKLKPKPGVLSLERCVELGVTPGPLLGKLKNGTDVTLPNGKTVKASDVRGPDDPGPIFIFLDIPDAEYLNMLWKKQTEFEPFQASAKSDNDAAMIVIHFSPENVVQLPLYQEFVDLFSPSTMHLYLNDRNTYSGYTSAHRIQWKLNQVHPNIFPILGESRIASTPDSVLPMSIFHLRPRKRLDTASESKLIPKEYLAECDSIPGFAEEVAMLHKDIDCSSGECCYPKIIFLGTGSCIPNKTRNVSSILVYTTPESCILLDCGEGTYGQIIRFYGQEKAQQVFRHLTGIYISHLHADHHIGLIGVLQARLDAYTSNEKAMIPLKLFAPEQIQSYLTYYHYKIEPIRHSYVLVRNLTLTSSELPTTADSLKRLGLKDIQTCLVPHCRHSYGVTLTLDDCAETKITYSGDCLPSEALIELGKDSTILIHEATMEDELEDEAKIKMHSTVSQAIKVGERMNAKYTILTHFSQRYAKLPRLVQNPGQNVGIAFDNMIVTVPDLENINRMYPTLKLLFNEDCEEMEQKAIKRMNKKLRLNDSTAVNL